VTALVASLGLGGLAFALVAKDTASNLFGSFTLLKTMKIVKENDSSFAFPSQSIYVESLPS